MASRKWIGVGFGAALALGCVIVLVTDYGWPPFSALPKPPEPVVAAPTVPLPRARRPSSLEAVARPSSPYDDRQRERFKALLANDDVDILVVPCMAGVGGRIERTERGVITAQLVQALAAHTRQTVANPYLIARLAGEWQTYLSDAEVLELARVTRAEHVVLCESAHFPRGRFGADAIRLTMQVLLERYDLDQPLSPPATTLPPAAAYFALSNEFRLPIDDIELPHRALRGRLEEAVKALGFDEPGATDGVALSTDKVVSQSGDAIPSGPKALLELDAENAEARVAQLEFVAALFPDQPRDARRRTFSKALVAAYQLPMDAPTRPVAIARALYYLDRRPAALAALGTQDSAAARALRAALNGDLPALTTATAEIPAGMSRLLAEFDLMDVRRRFDAIPSRTAAARIAELSGPLPGWAPFVHRRFADTDDWSRLPAGALKHALDKTFPLSGYRLEDLLSGSQVLDNERPDTATLNLGVLRHLYKLLDAEAGLWCCNRLTAGVDRWDIYHLFEAAAESELLKQTRYLTKTQSRPREALELLDILERSLRGHPSFAFERHRATFRLTQSGTDEDRAEWMRMALDAGLTSFLLSDEPSWEAMTAIAGMQSGGLPAMQYSEHQLNVQSVFPPNAYYQPAYYRMSGMELQAATMRRIDYATSSSVPVINALYVLRQTGPGETLARAMDELKTRFIGDSDATLLKVEALRESGEERQAMELLAADIATGAQQWPLYMQLGTAQLERGEYAQALATYLKYPRFAGDDAASDIDIDFAANDAASKFFWRGMEKPAREIFARGARTSSGSESDMQADIRVALLDGDYRMAAARSLDRATRYQSAYAYRDYLSFLFAFGLEAEGWAGFQALVGRFKTPHIWAATDVGARVQRRSDEDFRQWLHQSEVVSVRTSADSFAARHALLNYVIDREVPADLPALIAELEGSLQTRVAAVPHRVVRPEKGGADGNAAEVVLGPSLYRQHNISLSTHEMYLVPNAEGGGKAIHTPATIDSDLVMFAEGYGALRRGDGPAASAAFEKYATYYEPALWRLRWVLPYFAAAIAPSDNGGQLRKYLDAYPVRDRRFDWRLAMAFLEAAENHGDAALEHLDRALDMRPHTEARPIYTQYQWAEACEWLWLRTHDERYRERLLSWARAIRKTEPYIAWPYAMVVQYGAPGAERDADLGMALYLDAQSIRLKDVPEAERDKASRAFAKHNPFDLNRPVGAERGT